MIYSYGFSLAGRSHEAQSLPCQDAHIAVQLTEMIWLAAVADGVGSASKSDRGASVAVSSLASFLSDTMPADPDWKASLQDGFTYALETIRATAIQEQAPLSDYDTTLTAVLYDGHRAAYGHSGDGGIIGMDRDGHYQLLTRVQKGDAHNEVFPLRSGPSKWVFSDIGQDCAGLLLLTDGVLDVAVPALLSDQPEPLYLNLIRRFLSGCMLIGTPEETGRHAQEAAEFLLSPFCQAITDDMTVLTMWNLHTAIRCPDPDYFAEPDWALLRRIRFDRLYPQRAPNKEIVPDDCQEQQI